MAIERQERREFVFNAEHELSVLGSNYRDTMQKTKARYEFVDQKYMINGQERTYLKASGPRYQLEVELAYLANEITRGAKYIAPKFAQTAQQMVERFSN